MNTITTEARRVTKAYNENSHRGGRLHVWDDGTTRWETESSRYETPGEGYLGSIYLDPRERMTQAAAQEWIDKGGAWY